jgi:ubiquinone/menaquinone biosynthesis C-methylase UbiE
MGIYQPDRVLLASFVKENAKRLEGHLLDVGGADGKRYRGCLKQVEKYTVLDPEESHHPDIVSGAEEIPLNAASVDSMLCIEVLMYVDDVPRAVQEMARVLTAAMMGPKTSGTNDQWRFTDEGLRSLLEPYFEIKKVEQRGGYFTERTQHWIRHAIWRHDLYRRPLLGRLFSIVSLFRNKYATFRDAREIPSNRGTFTLGYNVLAVRLP